MELSLIIPCYNEEKNIFPFYEACKEALKSETEYIFINDGSKDQTFLEIKKLILENPKSNIKCLNFSRNFGKEAAMLAGMQKSKGKYVAIIDADLQQNPKYVQKMLDFLKDHGEYDSVACYQEKRIESKLKIFFKKRFYKFINKLSEVEFPENASDFRLLKRSVVNSILELKEYYRFSKGIFSWVGYDTYYMPYKVEERKYGTTSWSMKKLFKYALDGIISYSLLPLKIATVLGFISFIISIIYLIIIIIEKLTVGIAISGYPTIVCLILFFGGLQMILMGILGEYLGRTYMETKRRPKYIIKNDVDINTLKR